MIAWIGADFEGGNNQGRHCGGGDMAHMCGGCSFCQGDCLDWCAAEFEGGNNQGRRCGGGDMAHMCGGCSFCHGGGGNGGPGHNGMSIEEQMARVAGAVWSLQGWAAGWSLVHSIRQNNLPGDTDYMGVYQNGNWCAVAFQGTNNPNDYVKNFNVIPTSFCGFDRVHKGFVTGLQNFMNDDVWKNNMVPFLQSSACSAGIHVTGHSLGAAISALFSACANSASNPYGLCVDYLWNFAGPGPSQVQLTNGLSSDGCFAGARFWNEDGGLADPICGAASVTGMVHEKIKAVKLYWGCQVYQCDSTQATRLPYFNPLSLSRMEDLHDINKYYIPRIAAYFTSGTCSR